MYNYFSNDIVFAEKSLLNETTSNTGYIQGNIPILVSVPHCIDHMRDNNVKKAEINTLAIGIMLNKATGCHVLYNNDHSSDPNFDKGGAYKEFLLSTIKNHNIKFVADLHGAALSRDFDFELGTCDGRNLGGCMLAAELFNCISSCDFTKIDIDRQFKACNPNTISSFTFENTGIPAIQIEINMQNRDKEQPDRFDRTISVLVRFFSYLSCINFKFEDYYAVRVETSSSIQPHNRIDLPAEFREILSLNEIASITGLHGSAEVIIKSFTAHECVKVGKRVFDQVFTECPVALIHRSSYLNAKIYRPRVEAIDNKYIYISEDLYKSIGNTEYVEVLNTFCGIRAYYKAKVYTHNINSRRNGIWLSYLQRRLLNLELPIILTESMSKQLECILSDDDMKFFKNHYYDNGAGMMQLGKLNEIEHNRMKDIFKLVVNGVSLRKSENSTSSPKGQSGILKKYIGNTSIMLRVVRCTENDEILNGIKLTSTNLHRLGLSSGDKVYLCHRGCSTFVRVYAIEPESYSSIVRINNLDSEDDIEMVVCMPIQYRFMLGIKDLNECILIERDLMYLVRKNLTEQILALIGLFIAIVSIPGMKLLTGMISFLLLSPLVLYSILSKEREKI